MHLMPPTFIFFVRLYFKMSENKSKDKVELQTFIKKNLALISVIGIFAALSAFMSNLKEPYNTSAFLSFVIVVLVCFELEKNLPPKEKCSFSLIIFDYTFDLFLLFIILSVITTFTNGILVVITFIIPLFIITYISQNIAHYCLKKIKLPKIIELLFILIVYLLCILFSIALYDFTRSIFQI